MTSSGLPLVVRQSLIQAVQVYMLLKQIPLQNKDPWQLSYVTVFESPKERGKKKEIIASQLSG